MNKTGLNGSAIFHALALSPVALATAGSTTPIDMANYGWMNVVIASNSGALVANVARSATSNGTFSQVGCSLQSVASKLIVRGMPLESSATWVQIQYDSDVSGGSHISSVVLEGYGARRVPITQNSGTTVWSDVIP